jgi:hypothetical protein
MLLQLAILQHAKYVKDELVEPEKLVVSPQYIVCHDPHAAILQFIADSVKAGLVDYDAQRMYVAVSQFDNHRNRC